MLMNRWRRLKGILHYEWDPIGRLFMIFKGDYCIDICCSLEELDERYPHAVSVDMYEFWSEVEHASN